MERSHHPWESVVQRLFLQGSQGAEVRRIREAVVRELGAAADLFQGLAKGDLFDATLEAAVRQWQSGVGLMPDGIVGPLALQALKLQVWPALQVPFSTTAVQALFPATKPVNISRHWPHVAAALQAWDLCEREMVLAALGTIRAETEGFVPISEGVSKYNTAPGCAAFNLYDTRHDLGNASPGDGARFKGRGFVQLTGRDNYRRFGELLGIDLIARPDLANAPEVAAALLAAFLADRHDKLHAALVKPDLAKARKLVNGGIHGLDRFGSVFALAVTAMPAMVTVAVAKGGKVAPGKGKGKGKAAQRAVTASAVPRASRERTRSLTARKDTPDLRDRAYLPPPVSLSPEWPREQQLQKWLPKYAKAGLILDQGEEGACTGFGLAGVVNHLRWLQHEMPASLPSVSPRMLYNMARRYDEYAGENYEGSSCRGAIKGWFNHGVCQEDDWPYRSADQRQPRFGYADRARQHTLGVYYRIAPEAITDLQAAIQTVGAVFVSSFVHEGWNAVPTVKGLPEGHAHLPLIDYGGTPERSNGHAYALVGFNSRGFVLQNSWGPDWGAHGFAVLSYEDWLAHAMDAWVVGMGVPGLLAGRGSTPEPGSARQAARAAEGRAWWSESQAWDHSVVIGNDGRVSHYLTEDERTRSLAHQVTVLPDRWFRSRPKGEKKRLLLYVHGGLNSREAGITRARALGQVFERNGCYPLFIVWQTGLLESLRDIFEDWRRGQPAAAGGIGDWLIERSDALLERTVGRKAAKPIWSEMKENAALAMDPARAGHLLLKALTDLMGLWGDELEIHLVGHSAGSIWLGHLISRLQRIVGPTGRRALDWVPGIHLMAPACTVAFANEHYAATEVLPRTHIALLSDVRELDDNTAGVYRKSLLYFVSNALEPDLRTPILGMHKVFDPAQSEAAWDGASSTGEVLRAWRRAATEAKLDQRLTVVSTDKVQTAPGVFIPSGHGTFDNDIGVITEVLGHVLGGPLLEPVRDLKGY